MQQNYTLNEYQSDLKAADDLYYQVIKEGCICPFTGVIYSLNDTEIRGLKAKALAYKNQFLSAAGKRLRAGVALRLIIKLKNKYDVTQTLAGHICKQLLGRTINNNVLNELFATKGRTSTNKADFNQLDIIANDDLFISAKHELNDVLDQAKSLRNLNSELKIKTGSAAYNLLSKASK